jgi:hypothetical protein
MCRADASYNSSYVIDEAQNPYGLQDLNNANYRVYENDNAASPYAFSGYFNRPREVVLQAEYHY